LSLSASFEAQQKIQPEKPLAAPSQAH
jgi:hypothetical protein